MLPGSYLVEFGNTNITVLINTDIEYRILTYKITEIPYTVPALEPLGLFKQSVTVYSQANIVVVATNKRTSL